MSHLLPRLDAHRVSYYSEPHSLGKIMKNALVIEWLRNNRVMAIAAASVAGGALLLTFLPAVIKKAGNADDYGSAYEGSSTCRECHPSFYQKWESSHHGKAMQPFTPRFASERLTPPAQPVTVGDRRYTVDLVKCCMTEETSQGRVKRYAIRHVLGGKNVFYFLTPLEKGKLQVLPLAYQVNDHSWYDTTASMVRHFAPAGDEALDWKDPMLTFNTACFGCHVSQLEKNYDSPTRSYHTVWREPGISCESCHGPGERHNRACRDLPKGVTPTNLFLKSWRTFTPDQVNSACAPCHAKMHPLTSSFSPGDAFFDHYDLVCLEHPDFSPDGRDLGENYTYTLWLMNPCVRNSRLDCTHCHTSSGRYRFATNDVNGACASCHAAKTQRIAAHSRHPAEGATGRCVSCHMPSTVFAGMRRSDHSHRPPCPEAAMRFGSKSACVLCHTNKSEAWAAECVKTWHPESAWRTKILNEGTLVDAARKRERNKLAEICGYLTEEGTEPVVCASLLRLLRGRDEPTLWPVVRECLAHPSPLVRSAAATALADNLGDADTVRALLRALADPVRVVRLQAVSALAAFPRQTLDAPMRERLKRAETELLAMFESRPDDWASHFNLGIYRAARGDTKAAMQAYQESMRLRPDAVLPHMNAAVLASQQGNLQAALDYLKAGWKASPQHGAVNLNLGLALAETGDEAGALTHLRVALKDPQCRAQAAYNCAILTGRNDPAEAVSLCRIAVEGDPGNSRYAEALGYYLRAAGYDAMPTNAIPLKK